MNVFKIVLILFILSCSVCHSQPKDSLLLQWENLKLADTVRLEALNGYVKKILSVKADSAIWYSTLQVKEAKKLNNKKYQGLAFAKMAAAYHILGDNVKAIQHYEKALNIYEEQGDKSRIAATYNNIGGINYEFGRYDKALDYYISALELRKGTGDTLKIPTQYNNIGLVYLEQGFFEEATRYFNKALQLSSSFDNWKTSVYSLNNLGAVYNKMGAYEKSMEYFRTGTAYSRDKLNSQYLYGVGLNNIGEAFRGQQLLDSALHYYKSSLAVKLNINYKQGAAITLVNMAEIYYDLKRYNTALDYGNQGLKLAKEVNKIEFVVKAYDILYKSYKSLGGFEKSLDMLENHQVHVQLLNNEKTKEELIRMNFSSYYEQKFIADSLELKKEAEIKDLQIVQHKQQLKSEVFQKTVLVALIILLAVLIVVIYRNYSIKRSANNIISRKNDELARVNEEIQTLNDNLEQLVRSRTNHLRKSLSQLSKYHHDLVHNIRAPLATLLGMLNLINKDQIDVKKDIEVFEHIQKNSVALDRVIKSISQEMNEFETPLFHDLSATEEKSDQFPNDTD